MKKCVLALCMLSSVIACPHKGAVAPPSVDALDGGAVATDGGDTASDAARITPSDSGHTSDAADTGVDAACPLLLQDTGDPVGASIERDAFGCYGACGPSCKAECVDDTVTTWVGFPSGSGVQCRSCSYRVTACKSHAFCRWHDDCYRQCDLRWDAVHAEAPAAPPHNPCYLNCDNPVAHATALCGEDWSQLTTSTPSVRDACWDGSLVLFSVLTATEVAPQACPAPSDGRPRPWAPDVGAWDHFADPPATLPLGYSCTDDTDCPDRNQRCNPSAGDYPGINGWGRCEDLVPATHVDVKPLAPAGLLDVDGGRGVGAPCSVGYQCQGGWCAQEHCAEHP